MPCRNAMTPSPALKGVFRYRRYNHYNRDIIPRSNLVGHSDMEKMQVNCWVSGEAGERMRALAKAQNISYGQLLTALLLNQPVAVQDWQTAVSELIGRVNEMEASLSLLQSLQGGDELRGMIADQDVRLNALEVVVMTGLDAGNGKIRVKVEAAEIEAVGADDNDSLHPADPLPTAQEFNQDKDQFRAEVVNLYQQGVTGSPDILKILNEQGYRNSKGSFYYRNDVRQALKAAGLVE